MTWSLELWKITLGGLTSCREIITRRMGRTVTQIGNKNSVGGVTFEFAGTDSQGRDRWKCHRCWNIIRLTRVQTKHRAQGRVCLAHLALDTCSESGRQAHVEHRLVPTAGDAGVCIVATGVQPPRSSELCDTDSNTCQNQTTNLANKTSIMCTWTL